MNRKKWLIASLIVVSVMSAFVETLYYWRGMPSASATSILADILSVFLIALWIDADSKNRPQVARSFDYGWLVMTYLLPYLPYYLWRTRRAAGLLMFAGFVGLLMLGYVAQWTIYFSYR